MDISVVVPLYNEEESLPELVDWIKRVMDEHKYDFEIVLVDDGSSDSSWQIIKKMKSQYPFIKGIKFRRNYGKSAALYVGFEESQGDVVITMDADLQDSPDEIPGLYKKITEENYDLVSGWKKKRYDPISKTIPSKFFNWTARKVTKIKLHDFNCGLKAYKNDVVKSIEVYGEMHRYIPVLAKQAGFTKIGEQVVQHRARKYGVTKFGLERFVNGYLDLLTITFTTKFSKRPMHFFGVLGTLMFFLGFVVAAWIIFKKVYNLYMDRPVREVVDQPLFYLSLLAIILGVQLFLSGFIAELISRNSPDRNQYLIDKKV